MTGCITTAAVMPATAAELTRLSHVLAAAFATDPVSDWLFDGDQDTRHPQFFHTFLHHAHHTGRVEQTLDGTGVAVWFDNTHPADPIVELAFTDRVRDTVGHPSRWHTLHTAMRAAHHPAEPHWSLVFLGVLPAHQHKGYGHLLLHHATTWQTGHPAHLDATSRKLVNYYCRRGYHTTGLITVDNGPHLHPMTRPGTLP